jgi:hypothetical protein
MTGKVIAVTSDKITVQNGKRCGTLTSPPARK